MSCIPPPSLSPKIRRAITPTKRPFTSTVQLLSNTPSTFVGLFKKLRKRNALLGATLLLLNAPLLMLLRACHQSYQLTAIRNQFPVLDARRNDIRPQRIINFPPSYSHDLDVSRPSKLHHPPKFFQPAIIVAYSVRHNHTSPVHDLHIVTTGVNLGRFGRKFQPLACIVGNQVYPLISKRSSTIMCQIEHIPQDHEQINLLLQNDDEMKTALKLQEVPLKLFLSVTLKAGEIITLNSTNLDLTRVRHIIRKMDDGAALLALGNTLKWSQCHQEQRLKSEFRRKPRYHVCLVTQVKPFADLLADWISYHRRLGVDKVFIFDNNSPKGIPANVSRREDVEVLYWPHDRSQDQCLTYALKSGMARCKYLLATDVDEYLMLDNVMQGVNGKVLEEEKPLKRFLRDRLGDASFISKGVQLHFRYKTLSGNVKSRPKIPIPLAHVTVRGHLQKDAGKALCDTDSIWDSHRVHFCAPLLDQEAPFENGARLIHYKFRSWDELLEKQQFGSASAIDRNGMEVGSVGEDMPAWFEESKEEWVLFRENYKLVMRKWTEEQQRLVWEEGRKACRADVNSSGGVLREKCE